MSCLSAQDIFGVIFAHVEKPAEYVSHHKRNDNMGKDKALTDEWPVICGLYAIMPRNVFSERNVAKSIIAYFTILEECLASLHSIHSVCS